MNSTLDSVARMIAYAQGRAEPVTESTLLGDDPTDVFAVTFVKIVSEDAVQAIAYGSPDGDPEVLLRWNPMSRESNDLAAFAAALHAYLDRCFQADRCPRVWVAHEATRHLVDLLGRRYRTNPHATAELRRMGSELRALEEEAQIPGQQVLAVASSLLREHYVTGQSPSKDMHLGSLLHWIAPPHGASGAQVASGADRIALVPATNVLRDTDDDLAERLRRRAKSGRGRGPDRARLEALLERAVRAEWSLLVRARDAWLAAAVTPVSGAATNATGSLQRLRWNCDNGTPTLSRPAALARRLNTHTAAQDAADSMTMLADRTARRTARVGGHVFDATVVRVEQTTRNRFPCVIRMVSTQPVVRIRSGTSLALVGSNVTATVRDISTDADDRWLITVNVNSGVRNPPAAGQLTEWMPAAPPDLRFPILDSDAVTRLAGHPLATGEPLPAPVPRPMPDGLLERARAMRAAR